MAGNIISHAAFTPPELPTYDDSLTGLFYVDNPQVQESTLPISSFSSPKPAEKIACIQHPIGLPFVFTLLYSHGNAEDLGGVKDYAAFLSSRLAVNVVAYDYEGYGLTGGSASEANTLSNADTVYQHLVNTMNVDPDSIFVTGRSLGSGPAVYLASKNKVRGLILISPFKSAVSVISDSMATSLSYSDMFININNIGDVNCPVLIIHGDSDEVVPYSHGVELSKKCKSPCRLVTVEGGTHNGKMITHSPEVTQAMFLFITTGI